MTQKRREKFDSARREILLDLLRKGVRRTQACKKVGISRPTFNKCMNNNEKFFAEVTQAEVDANELVEQAMYKSALEGNVTAQQVWLYNRDPDRWKDKRNIQIDVPHGAKAESGFMIGYIKRANEIYDGQKD